MSFLKTIKEMDQQFSWSFLGFLMAIFFGAISLYLGFFKENTPDLKFIVTADSSVLDIKEKLGSLDILYKGDSLTKNNQDLRIITFKVINQGDSSILPNFYDKNDPVGFSITDGAIANTPILLMATNQYLKNKLIITKNADETVIFSNVILEPKEFFIIKILVLHKVGKTPFIKAFGKVAGVYNIDVITDYSLESSQSFLEKTFGAGITANVIRFIVYGFSFIYLLILISDTVQKTNSFKRSRKKQKLVDIFKDYDDRISVKDNFFFEYYISSYIGARAIENMHKIMSDKNFMKELDENNNLALTDKRRELFHFIDNEIFLSLKKERLITINNGNIVVDEDRFIVLTDFLNFLKRKGEL